MARNRFQYGQNFSISKSTINSILIFKVFVFIKNRHREGIYFLLFLTFYFFMEFEFLPINKMWFCTLWFRTKMLGIFHFFWLVRLWKVVLLLIGYIFEFRGAVYIGSEILMLCPCRLLESKIVHMLNYPVTFLYIECHFNLLFC